MKTKKISLSILLCLSFLISQAQEILFLDEVIQQTLETNYSIKIAKNTVAGEKLKVTRGNAGQLPNVSVGGRYSKTRSNVETERFNDITGSIDKVEDVFPSSDLGASLNASYTLFDGFAMFRRYEVLKESSVLAELNQRESIENVITRTISNYMEALRFQQQYLVLKESLNASNERYDLVKRRVTAGSATNLEELNAQVDMIADSSAVVEAELSFKNAVYELQYLMGQKNYTLAVGLDNSFSIDKDLDLNKMQISTMNKNVFIVQSNKNVDISSLQYRLSESARYPTLTAGGSYSWNKSETPTGFPRFRTGAALSGQLSLSFDIFNGGTKRINQQAAKVDWDNTILRKEDVKQMISKDLLIAYQNYTTRLRVLELLKGNMINAEENFSNSQKSYDAGVITSLELRQAQVNLANAKNRINDAKINAKLAEVNVKRLSGVLLE